MAATRHSGFCGIAVMAKASQPGRTKTRLCPPLTLEEAAACNTAFLRDIADNLSRRRAWRRSRARWPMDLPDMGPSSSGYLPGGVEHFEVWEPEFGPCLSKALEAQFAAHH